MPHRLMALPLDKREMASLKGVCIEFTDVRFVVKDRRSGAMLDILKGVTGKVCWAWLVGNAARGTRPAATPRFPTHLPNLLRMTSR